MNHHQQNHYYSPKATHTSLTNHYCSVNFQGQLDSILQNQRKKFKQIKENMESDLDIERKVRVQYENKLVKVKNQISKKQIIISQLQFQLNNLSHQNQDIITKNDTLKKQLAMIQNLYSGKIRQLQGQITMEVKNLQEIKVEYNKQFQKFKKQGQDYIQQLTFQFQRKIKNLQEKSKTLQNTKRELTLENKKLNDILINNKLSFEEQIRDGKNKSKEEELKRSQLITKSYEQKLKLLQQSKQVSIRKNHQFLRLLQDKDQQIQNLRRQHNQEIIRYKQEIQQHTQHIRQLNHLITKLKSQILQKNSLSDKTNTYSDDQYIELKKNLDNKKQQNINLYQTIKNLKQTFKQAQIEWQRGKKQLSDYCFIFEVEAKKYKEQYQRICQILKTKINETINNVTYNK